MYSIASTALYRLHVTTDTSHIYKFITNTYITPYLYSIDLHKTVAKYDTFSTFYKKNVCLYNIYNEQQLKVTESSILN